jgi:hypothetical protein
MPHRLGPINAISRRRVIFKNLFDPRSLPPDGEVGSTGIVDSRYVMFELALVHAGARRPPS